MFVSEPLIGSVLTSQVFNEGEPIFFLVLAISILMVLLGIASSLGYINGILP